VLTKLNILLELIFLDNLQKFDFLNSFHPWVGQTHTIMVRGSTRRLILSFFF